MNDALAAMLVERLNSNSVFRQHGAKLWHLRVPVSQSKPYVLFSGPDEERDETATQQVMSKQSVQFTVVGDRLADQVAPLAREIKAALEDYLPDLTGSGIRLLRAKVVRGPIYDEDNDGQQDVFVAGVAMEFTIQTGKG